MPCLMMTNDKGGMMARKGFQKLNAEERVKALAGVLYSHTATPAQEFAVHKLVGKARSDLMSMERVITAAIYDGLAYGNWPWIDHISKGG